VKILLDNLQRTKGFKIINISIDLWICMAALFTLSKTGETAWHFTMYKMMEVKVGSQPMQANLKLVSEFERGVYVSLIV
jgi:hypothetical protein